MSEKLTIKDITAAIDMGAKSLWSEFTDEQKKQVTFYTLNRFASSVNTRDRDVNELVLLKTNEFFNKHFFALSKHPQLLWQLLCMCNSGDQKILYHEWIGHKKKGKDGSEKIVKFLESVYTDINDTELEILTKKMTKAEVKQLAQDLGMDDSEIKKLLS